jgi:large subunit ribosomal protein L23
MSNEKVQEASPKDFATIRRPIVTEKGSGSVAASLTLEVDPRASKLEIRRAVEKVFGAEVKSVRTLNVLGKTKRSARGQGRRRSYKKAYIELKEGQTVDIVDGV